MAYCYQRMFLLTFNILFNLYEIQSLTTTTATNNNLPNLTPRNNNRYSTSIPSATSSTSGTINNIKHSLKTQQRLFTNNNNFKSKKNSCNDLCPEPPEDMDLDRREATFALLGSIWSMTTGITTSLSMTTTNPAHAIYGEDAKIQVPDMLGGMNDRVNKQCIVESLGNRECLVYLDPELKLYKGPDSELLLTRLENAIIALNSLPDLITSKKWSKVTSVLTGPMGTLIGTMKKLSENAEDVDTAVVLTKKVKEDLYAINAAVERKQVDKALLHQGMAIDDLNEFILAL